MTKNTILCWIYVIASVLSGAVTMAVADENRTGTLTVVISDFKNTDGYAMVALSNSKENYEQGVDEAFAKRKGKIVNAVAKVVFKDLPYGKYAIMLYHDQNSNGEMDTDVMGIPKEPYAFSNNARGMFGKPDWHKVAFKLGSAKKEINISLQ
jgi:uncharacterized protein (DUF2141 family)